MNGCKLTASERRRLQQQLRRTVDVREYRRTLAVLEFDRCRSAGQIAQMLGVTRQSVYNWVEAYARTRDPAALTDAPRPGRPKLWTPQRQALLEKLLENPPDQMGYFARSWTVPLLQEELKRQTGLSVSDRSIRDELHRQRFVWKRPRYQLEPDLEREKKTRAGPLGQATPSPSTCAGGG